MQRAFALSSFLRTWLTPLWNWAGPTMACVLVAGAVGADRPNAVFNVRELGATGDGHTLDTPAIQKAFDECGKAGGSVRFPPGVYLSRPVFLRSGITVQLDAGATLRATNERADFLAPENREAGTSSRGLLAFVNGKNLTNITLTGAGTIDGAGALWWKPVQEAKRTKQETPASQLPRPRLVVLTGCKNVRVENLTLINSPSFHLVPTDCEDVVIENLTITAPNESPNTDGIDPSVCRRVRISKCRIDVGDDNIALKSGKLLPGRAFACEDITVNDCVFLHGHGLSIGSETVGGVRNLTVQRCVFVGTENGIRIKSPRGRGGTVENITYRDIQMTNVDPAITITCYYPKVPKEDTAEPLSPTTPSFRNVRISNLTATCLRSAGLVIGLPESPVLDVILENTTISAATGLTVRNAKGVRFKQVAIQAAQGPPVIRQAAEIEGLDLAQPQAPER